MGLGSAPRHGLDDPFARRAPARPRYKRVSLLAGHRGIRRHTSLPIPADPPAPRPMPKAPHPLRGDGRHAAGSEPHGKVAIGVVALAASLAMTAVYPSAKASSAHERDAGRRGTSSGLPTPFTLESDRRPIAHPGCTRRRHSTATRRRFFRPWKRFARASPRVVRRGLACDERALCSLPGVDARPDSQIASWPRARGSPSPRRRVPAGVSRCSHDRGSGPGQPRAAPRPRGRQAVGEVVEKRHRGLRRRRSPEPGIEVR